MLDIHRAKRFIAPKLKHIRQFLIAQGAIQVLTALLGFLCVRLLSVPGYAKYTIFYGAFSALNGLTDMGFTGTLAGLIGERVNDRQVVADYIESIRVLRKRLFWIGAPLVFGVLPILVRRQHWSLAVVVSMAVAVIVSTWFSTVSSSYGAVLILLRARSDYYKIQTYAAALRLVLIIGFALCHSLNVGTAVGSNILGSICLAALNYRKAKALLGRQGKSSAILRRNMIHLAWPNVPNLFFLALQGQITVVIATVFGQTANIADIGALSRMVQMFAVLGQMNTMLIEPYFGRLSRARLKINYLGTLLLGACCLIAVTTVTALWPGLFLAVLGAKYENLRVEVVWTVATGGISTLNGLLYAMNSARRFVFWWFSWLNIGLVLTAQILFAMHANFGSVRDVIILGFASGCASTVAYLSAGIAGFVQGPRAIEETAVPEAAALSA